MSLKSLLEKLAALEQELDRVNDAISKEGVWVNVYPGEEEDEVVLKQVGAVCVKHMVAYLFQDGYGSRWVCTREQYSEYKALLSLNGQEEED